MLNKVMYVSIINVCVNLVVLYWGKEIYFCVMKVGFMLDVSVVNVFISMYVRCGSIKDVCFVFDKMGSRRDVILWIVMIGGFVKSGFIIEVWVVF